MIGGDVARRMAAEGAKIVIVDYDTLNGRKVADSIVSAGGEAIFIKTNVAVTSECEYAVDTAYQTYGKIDILNNNAGVHSLHTLEELTDAEWERVVPINGKSYFTFMRLIVPQMARMGGGAVVNTASLAGVKGGHGDESIYAFCKAGIIQMSLGLARAYASKNVRINCISPGLTPSPLNIGSKGMEEIIANIPMGRAGKAEDQANGILFLASEEASWITGRNLIIDGGDYDSN